MAAHDPVQALRRLWNDLRHPLTINLEDENLRLGWIDLSHAYSNAWVEILRSIFRVPDEEKGVAWHWAGRGVAWSTPIWVGLWIMVIL